MFTYKKYGIQKLIYIHWGINCDSLEEEYFQDVIIIIILSQFEDQRNE